MLKQQHHHPAIMASNHFSHITIHLPFDQHTKLRVVSGISTREAISNILKVFSGNLLLKTNKHFNLRNEKSNPKFALSIVGPTFKVCKSIYNWTWANWPSNWHATNFGCTVSAFNCSRVSITNLCQPLFCQWFVFSGHFQLFTHLLVCSDLLRCLSKADSTPRLQMRKMPGSIFYLAKLI